jgi:hypothetical protein
MAVDKQKKHEWDELEILIRSITQLEPQFITPWLYQSWNLAYNVSAESDRVRDKYFYISRGIELLAEGERRNRNHPTLRFDLGYYYMDRIGVADQQRTLRTLFQLSCIDPVDRDPARFRLPGGKLDMKAFRAFCESYPHLVRRLREMQNCRTPEDVVEFLADHYEVPSRYEAPPRGSALPGGSRLKPAEKQFPILPRPDDLSRSHAEGYQSPFAYAYSANDQLPPEFDNYLAAQLWFNYALAPLPPPNPVPGPGVTDYDRTRYRLPRRPATLVFRDYPAKAQTKHAEQLQREGWFNRGWEIDEGQQGSNRWFPDLAVVGQQPWSSRAWEKAFRMWRLHGELNGLYLEPAELDRLEKMAALYRQRYSVRPGELDQKLRPEDFSGEMRQAFEAHAQLFWYQGNRKTLTNYPQFYFQAEAEMDPQAVQARDLFFQARRKRKAAEPGEELERYEKAIPLWKGVLNRYPDYRSDLFLQEFTWRVQHRYLELLMERQSPQARNLLALQTALEGKNSDVKALLLLPDFSRAALLGPGFFCLPSGHLLIPGKLVEAPRGPFDELPPDGKPYITPGAIDRARTRLHLDE